jgi:hypothetical protein
LPVLIFKRGADTVSHLVWTRYAVMYLGKKLKTALVIILVLIVVLSHTIKYQASLSLNPM